MDKTRETDGSTAVLRGGFRFTAAAAGRRIQTKRQYNAPDPDARIEGWVYLDPAEHGAEWGGSLATSCDGELWWDSCELCAGYTLDHDCSGGPFMHRHTDGEFEGRRCTQLIDDHALSHAVDCSQAARLSLPEKIFVVPDAQLGMDL